MGWNKIFYVAKRLGVEHDDFGNEIPKYDTPVKVIANIQPVSGNSDILAYGERTFKMYRVLLNSSEWTNKIFEGDVGYLEGVVPTGEAFNGANANYRINSIRIQNYKIAVYFDKIQK